MDYMVSGEERDALIRKKLDSSVLYVAGHSLQGFYIPGAGESPIIAVTRKAGIELMKIKHAKEDKAVLPSENITGRKFLQANGFAVTETKGFRMIRGESIDWQSRNIYSRIGGNFG